MKLIVVDVLVSLSLLVITQVKASFVANNLPDNLASRTRSRKIYFADVLSDLKILLNNGSKSFKKWAGDLTLLQNTFNYINFVTSFPFYGCTVSNLLYIMFILYVLLY